MCRFFFKQKTAYEMRISDGSSDVCSSDLAVSRALAGGGKAFYTAPIKALSNQKYADLARRHGSERVGLLTGDNSINGDAPVVVMTTEENGRASCRERVCQYV